MKKFLSVLLAVMMVLSTVSFAAPSAVGTFDAAVEAPAADFVPEVADLAAESQYGTLLFDFDFESEAFTDGLGSGGNYIYYSSKTQPVLPAEFEGNYYAFVGNTIECATVDTDAYELNGTNVLKVYANSNPSYPHVAVQALKDSSTWDKEFPGFPDGTYTIVVDAAYDYNNSVPGKIVARFSDTGSYGGGNAIGQEYELNYEMANYVISWDVLNQADGTTKVIAANGTEKAYATIKSMGVYFGQMGNNPDFIYVDNYQMYWKPNTVNVEIKNNGETVKTIKASTKGVLVSDLVKEAGIGADYSVTSVKVNGETKLLSEKVVFGADSVVEITSEKLDLSAYENAEKGKLLFNITFEDCEAGFVLDNESHKSLMLTDTYKTPYADSVMSHDLKNWAVCSSGATYSVMADPKNPDNKVVGALNVTSTGYPHIRIDTYVDTQERKGDRADVAWGFVEEDGGVFTVEYDFMDVNGNLAVTERFGGASSVEGIDANAKWTEREDLATEYDPAITAGEYRTQVATYSDINLKNMGSTAEASFIKIHAARPTNNSYYIDNIKLWYKPGKADITVKHIGVDLPDTVLEGITTSGVSAAEIAAKIDTTGIDTISNKVVGLAFKADGSDVTTGSVQFSGDATVYLVWEQIDMSEWQDENGTILFDIDFDDLADGTKINHLAKLASFGRVNPYFAGSSDWFLNLSQFGTVQNQDYGVVENGALKFTKTAKGKWAQIQVSAGGGKVLASDGVLYKMADMKYKNPSGIGVNLGLTGYTRMWNGTKWEGTTNNQASVMTIKSDKTAPDTWFTLEGAYTLEGQEYNGEECIIYLPTYDEEGGVGDSFYLDNLKLYWKPAKVNVLVKNVGYEAANVMLEGVSTSGITVNELVTLANVPANASYKVKGVSFNEDGSDLKTENDKLNFAVDTVVYLIWEKIDMSAYSDANGILLFAVDFNDLALGTEIKDNAKISTFGKVNPFYANSENYGIQFSTFTNGRVTDHDNDGNYELAVDYASTGKWPQVLLGMTENKVENALTGGGTYYATMSYNVPSTFTDLVSVGLVNNGIKDGVHQGPSGLMHYADIYTSNAAFKYNTWATLANAKNTNEAGINDITKITNLFTMKTGGQHGTIYLDDIKLYWRPHTVNVTIDMGENTEVKNITFEMKTTGVRVDDVMTNVLDWGSKKLVGLSRTEGGAAIPTGTLLHSAFDVTYYAIWEDYGAVLEGYGAEFNEGQANDYIGWATYGTGADGGAVYNYASDIRTEDETSFMSVKSIPAEGATGLIDAQLRLPVNLPKGTLKGVALRMRYRNMPTTNYEVVTADRTISDVTINHIEAIKMYAGMEGLGLAESRSANAYKDFTGGALEGKWFTVYFDFSAKDYIASNNLEYFRIDIPDAFPADAIVDFDYIRFYGDDSALPEKPNSRKDAIAIRANAGNEDGKNGLRFKAELSGETNEVATEYGWVAADAMKVTTRAITMDFSKAVKTYYGRQEGVDLVNFFEETDELKTFTAVITGIKPEYAKRTIVIRPFVKVDGVYYYGEPMANNVYDIACAIRDGGYVDADKDYIDSIIAAADALEA